MSLRHACGALTLSLLVFAGTGVLLPGCTSVGQRFLLSPAGPADRPSDSHSRALDLMPADRPSGRNAAEEQGVSRDRQGEARPSPDGKWVAFQSPAGPVRGIYIARADGRGARRVSGSEFAAFPAWSPDSARLAFIAREFRDPDAWRIWVFDVASGGLTRLPATRSATSGIAWFPDNRRICYGNDGALVVLDTVTRASVALRLPNNGRIAGIPVVSPDGQRIVFAVPRAGAWVASVADGRVVKLDGGEEEVDALAWSPGGREVALRSATDGHWHVAPIWP